MSTAPWFIGEWRKSSFSDAANGCVEACLTEACVELADTKQHGAGPVLHVDHTAWRAFVAELDARSR